MLVGERVPETTHLRGHVRQAVIPEGGLVAREPLLEPVVVKSHAIHVLAIGTERMHVGVPDPQPVDELDAELERRIRMAHEIGFVEAEAPVEVVYGGNRGFADTDSSDRLRFDEPDGTAPGIEHA